MMPQAFAACLKGSRPFGVSTRIARRVLRACSSPRGPAAVPWFVVAVVVDAFERQAWTPRPPHIGPECFKADLPSLAYTDASRPVVAEPAGALSTAARTHRSPRLISRVADHVVLSLCTSATHDNAMKHIRPTGLLHHTTVTANLDVSGPIGSCRSFRQNGQASKPLARDGAFQHRLCHGSDYRAAHVRYLQRSPQEHGYVAWLRAACRSVQGTRWGSVPMTGNMHAVFRMCREVRIPRQASTPLKDGALARMARTYAPHRYSLCTSRTNRCAKPPRMKGAPGSDGCVPRRSGAE